LEKYQHENCVDRKKAGGSRHREQYEIERNESRYDVFGVLVHQRGA
jgi:hypothetical protein